MVKDRNYVRIKVENKMSRKGEDSCATDRVKEKNEDGRNGRLKARRRRGDCK